MYSNGFLAKATWKEWKRRTIPVLFIWTSSKNHHDVSTLAIENGVKYVPLSLLGKSERHQKTSSLPVKEEEKEQERSF